VAAAHGGAAECGEWRAGRTSDAATNAGLDAAIDWCHQGILGLPLSEEEWAEAKGLIGRIKAMVGPDQVKRAHILPRSNGPGCNHAVADW
jgi:hypothetical protein